MDRIFDDVRFKCDALGPNDQPGVYAICVISRSNMNESRVVYIGSSENILKRVLNKSHVYRRLTNLLRKYHVVCYCYHHIGDILSLEKELIKKYRPRFNVQYNG
jgi:excinuclease UvrABC nuclease subunit